MWNQVQHFRNCEFWFLLNISRDKFQNPEPKKVLIKQQVKHVLDLWFHVKSMYMWLANYRFYCKYCVQIDLWIFQNKVENTDRSYNPILPVFFAHYTKNISTMFSNTVIPNLIPFFKDFCQRLVRSFDE